MLLPALERALMLLPPQFGEVLRLIDCEGYAYREAATRLQVPVGTVMSRLHRARRLLLAQIREPGVPAEFG